MSEKTLSEHQAEVCRAYVGGGVGAIISGIIWGIAAMVEARSGISAGFFTLFFGGMLIFPLGLFICRIILKRAPESKTNPGGRIVIETLPGMFVGLGLAYVMIFYNADWVFPIAAMAVGAHYFSFRTAYGDITYWILGAIMTAIGAAVVFMGVAFPISVAAIIAAVEIVFGVYLAARNWKVGG